MKKNIISAAVVLVICLSTAQAQTSITVSNPVANQFASAFAGASNVEWSKKDQTFVAKFLYQNNTWAAYYSENGDLQSSGRKISSLDLLPLQVQAGISQIRDNQERKFGAVDSSYAFEMISDKGTQYYIPLANSHVAMMLIVDSYGNAQIGSKTIRNTPASPDRDLIAKRN